MKRLILILILCSTVASGQSKMAFQVHQVTASSIAQIQTALKNDDVDEIIVTDGTYLLAPAWYKDTTCFYIGADYASRTRPVKVRPQTPGGVTFSGWAGAVRWSEWAALYFGEGAHHQTWDGFNFTGGYPFACGVVTFGGYAEVPAHDITLKNFLMYDLFWRSQDTSDVPQDWAVYFSWQNSPAYNLKCENFTIVDTTVDATHGGLAGAFAFGPDDTTGGRRSPINTTITNVQVYGTTMGTILYTPNALTGTTITGVVTTDPRRCAVKYYLAPTGITMINCTSTGSGIVGYEGTDPHPGLTFTNCDFK